MIIVSYLWYYRNPNYSLAAWYNFLLPSSSLLSFIQLLLPLPFHSSSAPCLCLSVLPAFFSCWVVSTLRVGTISELMHTAFCKTDFQYLRENCVQHFFLELSSLGCSLGWLSPFLHHTVPSIISHKLWNVFPFSQMPWIYVFLSISIINTWYNLFPFCGWIIGTMSPTLSLSSPFQLRIAVLMFNQHFS